MIILIMLSLGLMMLLILMVPNSSANTGTSMSICLICLGIFTTLLVLWSYFSMVWGLSFLLGFVLVLSLCMVMIYKLIEGSLFFWLVSLSETGPWLMKMLIFAFFSGVSVFLLMHLGVDTMHAAPLCDACQKCYASCSCFQGLDWKQIFCCSHVPDWCGTLQNTITGHSNTAPDSMSMGSSRLEINDEHYGLNEYTRNKHYELEGYTRNKLNEQTGSFPAYQISMSEASPGVPEALMLKGPKLMYPEVEQMPECLPSTSEDTSESKKMSTLIEVASWSANAKLGSPFSHVSMEFGVCKCKELGLGPHSTCECPGMGWGPKSACVCNRMGLKPNDICYCPGVTFGPLSQWDSD